jgi:uncharacterized membrane protein
VTDAHPRTSDRDQRDGKPPDQARALSVAVPPAGRKPGVDQQVPRVVEGLAALSLALGALETGAPGLVSRLAGADAGRTSRAVARWVCGARELVVGAGIAGCSSSRPWLRARVTGDVVDLVLLAAVLARRPAERRRAMAALTAVACITAVDVQAARRTDRGTPVRSTPLTVRAAVTVNRPVGEIYAFWRDATNLPRFVSRLRGAPELGPGRFHWSVRGRAARTVGQEVELVEDLPDEQITWQVTRITGTGPHVARVRFRPAPGARGTEVHVQLVHLRTSGWIGSSTAALRRATATEELRDDLRRFRQVLETGEVVRSG